MKPIPILSTLLILAMLISIAGAATENKDLPTQTEITDYLSGLPTNNFVSSASESSMNDNPSWKWDTWTDANENNLFSFYYSASTPKGYGSVYFDDSGNQLGKMCGMDATLVKSYTGEAVPEVVCEDCTRGLVQEEVAEAPCKDCEEEPEKEVTETKTKSRVVKKTHVMEKQKVEKRDTAPVEIEETESTGIDIQCSAEEIKDMDPQEKTDLLRMIYNILMGK